MFQLEALWYTLTQILQPRYDWTSDWLIEWETFRKGLKTPSGLGNCGVSREHEVIQPEVLMCYLIPLAIAVIGWFVFSNISRGKRFVRAVDFLMLLDGGATVKEANGGSLLILTNMWPEDLNRQAIDRANREAALHYNGKQLPLIKLAVSKGFKG